MRIQKVLFCLLISAIMSGCGLASATEGLPGQPISSEPPGANLTIAGTTQPAGLGSYCWTNPEVGEGICADMIGIPTVHLPLRSVSPIEGQIQLEIATDPTEWGYSLHVLTPELELEFDDPDWRWWSLGGDFLGNFELDAEGTLTLDLEPGLYLISLYASWEAFGSASYGFLLRVDP